MFSKGIQQVRRRFSLQPSSGKDDHDGDKTPKKRDCRKSSENKSCSTSRVITHKIVVLGGSECGKTSILHQFLYNSFSRRYKSTLDELHHGEFDMGQVHLSLQIIDTSGKNEFPAMRDLCITRGDAFVIVYDICDAESFEIASGIRDEIIEKKGTTAVPIVVVGNKLDLAAEFRQVDFQTTESVVTLDWENGFVESSAKDGTNISAIFKELLHRAGETYDFSPVLGRRRRQSLPEGGGSPARGQFVSPLAKFRWRRKQTRQLTQQQAQQQAQQQEKEQAQEREQQQELTQELPQEQPKAQAEAQKPEQQRKQRRLRGEERGKYHPCSVS